MVAGTLLALLVILSIFSCHGVDADKYYILVDAGSTGSRSFIYRIRMANDAKNITTIKGKKVTPGLSDFVRRTGDILDYVMPIIRDAAAQIPEDLHQSTELYFSGTAGMRLLSEEDQTNVWDSLYESLKHSEANPFPVNRNHFNTINGFMEAYYAALASNYIAGSIDSNLRPVSGKQMVGALDMGGSSTQLIFYTPKNGYDQENLDPISPEDFWSHSWLNFGAERIRERVIEHFVSKYNRQHHSDGGVIHGYPCTFRGYELTLDDGTVIIGSGEGRKCSSLIREVLWPGDSCPQSNFELESHPSDHLEEEMEVLQDLSQGKTPCFVGGVEHPPIQGTFYGMSVYFFALDCIRHLGQKEIAHWPNPTIDDLEVAVQDFCGLNWSLRKDELLGSKHPYTKDSQLPHRCLEAMYMLVLLEDGFGFHGEGRSITLALEIEGQEVEWTLGFALAEIKFH